MTAKNVEIGAPFGWIAKSLDVGRRDPGALFGGILLVLVVGLVPSVLQFAGDALSSPGSATWIAMYALSVVASLLLLPPLVGGAFRLVHRVETGQAVRATDVFDGYRLPGFAVRMIALAFAFMAVYVLALAALYAVLPGKEAIVEIFQRMMATPPGGQPDLSGLPSPPGGLLWWLLGAMTLLVLLGNAYMLAFAQAALAERPAGAALGDGFAGAFRNVLAFLAFAIAAFVVGVVVLLIAAIVIGLVVGLLAMASPMLAVAVAVPLYLVLMLGLYVLMFGFYYHAWRDIFGGGGAPLAPAGDAGTLAA